MGLLDLDDKRFVSAARQEDSTQRLEECECVHGSRRSRQIR